MPYKDRNKAREYHRDYMAGWNKRNPKVDTSYWTRPGRQETTRRAKLLRDYGITLEAFNEMVVAQNNQCAICLDIFVKTPHIDHDHSTGRVRGLLCGNCNKGLGHFRDIPDRLRRAAEYLEDQTK